MKNLLKFNALLTVGCALLLTAFSSWAIPPERYTEDPIWNGNVPFFDCSFFGMNFEVMGEWFTNEYGTAHFDKKGNLLKVNGFYYLTQQRVWNSTEPDKDLTGEDVAGKAEHSHFILRFDENGVPTVYMESGVFTKMVVPGYGQIQLNAGHVKFLFNDGEWILTQETPNTSPELEDAYALCTYLQ